MNLSKSAMLVSATISNGGLLGERRDNMASALVENTYAVAHRRAKASKFLIDRKHKSVRNVVAASQRVREIVYRYTVPWGDEKMRLLPVKAYDEFTAKLEVAIAELKQAQEAYLHVYPALISASERDLGGLFDASQYPPTKQVREMFSVSVRYWPLPEAGHFVADISDASAKEAREAINREIETRLKDASKDLIARAKETVTTFMDKLSNYRVEISGEGKQAKSVVIGAFRDTLVENILDTAMLIEKLNVTQDKEIAELSVKLQRLGHYSAQILRDNPAMRETKVSEAQVLLNQLDLMDQTDSKIRNIMADTSDYM